MTSVIIKYIKPECMPYFYDADGIMTDRTSAVSQHIAYTSDGYMLPCCWCDAPSTRGDMIAAGLYDESLKLSNNTSVENILLSSAWGNFISTMLHDPVAAATCCREKCGVFSE